MTSQWSMPATALTLAADASSQDHVGQFAARSRGHPRLCEGRCSAIPGAARRAKTLVAADINAVPPAGIEGIGRMTMVCRCRPHRESGRYRRARGRHIKYQVMRALFDAMLQSEQPLYLDFRDAFESARKLAA